MVKRNFRTKMNDGLVLATGGAGIYKAVETGLYLGKELITNYSEKLQEIGGYFPELVKCGPAIGLGGLALIGTVLAFKGVDKISLENQLGKYQKEAKTLQNNVQKTQEEINDYQEYMQGLQEDITEKQEEIRVLEETVRFPKVATSEE